MLTSPLGILHIPAAMIHRFRVENRGMLELSQILQPQGDWEERNRRRGEGGRCAESKKKEKTEQKLCSSSSTAVEFRTEFEASLICVVYLWRMLRHLHTSSTKLHM